jgi:hypothetical protein
VSFWNLGHGIDAAFLMVRRPASKIAQKADGARV